MTASDYLLRLAVALPLVLLLAAITLLAAKRGWLPFAAPGPGKPWLAGREQAMLEIRQVTALGPGARIAHVRFGGRDLLLGVSGQGVVRLAADDTTTRRESSPCP
ncbi:flagellar biosynthetic protein FliO [Sandaracinobacteroides sp. A072]|uniref:flagellar biosynthetic protein FliO n=1 Tax=Sandaracinobacteroides sp. A072 TaxID=3461146 RepID=UPI004042C40A